MDEEKNILEILLDEENDDLIELLDGDGKSTYFEQVAIVPLDNEQIYVILKPVDPESFGINDGEAVVFRVEYDEDGVPYLAVETDDEIGDRVFDVYYDLLDECEE